MTVAPQPRKRATVKGARTRRRVLDAAAAELAELGPAAANLAGVAERAGIKAGSIYFHFESRDALFRAVLETGLSESIDRITAALNGVSDPIEQLRALIATHVALMTELSDYTTVAVAMADQFDHETTREFRTLQRRYSSVWTDVVDRAVSTGVLPGGAPPGLLADFLVGGLNAVRKRAQRSPAEVIATAERVTGIDRR